MIDAVQEHGKISHTAGDGGDIMIESWEARHFSLSNPAGENQSSIPLLLRKLADTIEDLGDVEVLDVTFSDEVVDGAGMPSFSVYFTRR